MRSGGWLGHPAKADQAGIYGPELEGFEYPFPTERFSFPSQGQSSVVHAAIMAVQALYDSREHGHLVGDVPALLLVAFVLWFLSPTNKVASRAAG